MEEEDDDNEFNFNPTNFKKDIMLEEQQKANH